MKAILKEKLKCSKRRWNHKSISAYSHTENGKGIGLRIGNGDIAINGLFFNNNDGTTTDLFDGSEDDSEEKSNLIISIAPPSEDLQNSLSGDVNIANIISALESDACGVISYTLVFDEQFEDYEDNIP